MKTLQQIFKIYQQTLNVLIDMNESNKGNYEVYFDENLFEVSEDEVADGELYKYTSRSVDELREMLSDCYTELTEKINELGFQINCPYGDSIYIFKTKGTKAISLRNHEVKSSTLNHWDEILYIDINNGTLKEEMLIELN